MLRHHVGAAVLLLLLAGLALACELGPFLAATAALLGPTLRLLAGAA